LLKLQLVTSNKNLVMNQKSNHSIYSTIHKELESTTNLFFPKFIFSIISILFLGSLSLLVIHFNGFKDYYFENIFRINGFSFLIWTTVTFFSSIVSKYAINYLQGFKYQNRFMILCLVFTLSVMMLVIANHIVVLLLSWLLMGLLMSQLIGIDKDWKEAKAALRYTRKYFITGFCFLTIGVLNLAFYSNEYYLEEIVALIPTFPKYILIISAVSIILAAVVQSAMYPFHKWLLSAMTAPTPASALMHAGFVNGAGILLTLFAPLFFKSNLLTTLFIIGGFTAVIAQFTKLIQVNVKQKLACSTIAQMGFMIMQCGLGFFNAAVAHLILHGFYKAYLFMSSGEEVQKSNPKDLKQLKIKPLQAILVLLFGLMGALLFVTWTGKGLALNSGLFLTLVVAITVGQITYNIVKEKSFSVFQKMVFPAILFILGIGLYSITYVGVTHLLEDMPMVDVPTRISWPQIIFGLLFLIGFFIMKLGVYKKLPWLYVKLLNLSQPYRKTI